MSNTDNPKKTKRGKSPAWYKNWYLKQTLLAVTTAAAVVFFLFFLLKLITRHNQELEVPDLTGMNLTQAARATDALHLRLEVTDSVYINRMAPGTVFKQNPGPGSHVKKNRRILLTINSTRPKMVKMPSLVGFSLRQAQAELAAGQLRIGKLIYREDLATNNVLGQLYKGRDIFPGREIPSESTIDLILGQNPENSGTYIPNLTGIPYQRLKESLTDRSLNLDRAVFDSGIHTYADSLEASVYKQMPAPTDTTVTLGTAVTVYLTKDTARIKNALSASRRQRP